jgi:hypothetical protein
MATPCTLPLVAIEADACDAQQFDYGQQIRTILYQDMSGVAPDLLGTKTTPATLAQVQDALTAAAPDKLFVLKDLAGGLVPASSDTTISGNDVPGGGTILVNRTNTFTGRTDLITPTLVDSVNKMILRGGQYRLWFVDNNSYVQGYANDATIGFASLERGGIGGASNRIPLTVTWLSKTILPLGFAPIAGINALTNV